MPRNTVLIIGQSSPGPHYFFVGNIAPDFQMPQNPTIFYYFCRKILPRTTLYLLETAPDPTIFYFYRSKILPRTSLGHRHLPIFSNSTARKLHSIAGCLQPVHCGNEPYEPVIYNDSHEPFSIAIVVIAATSFLC